MENSEPIFDVLVLGAGHAGTEAAWMASQYPLSVGIVSLPGVAFASAPCNPSVGGVGKGQLVREIDALGGLMGRLADEAGIQYRTLNESKGAAVRSTRVQIDKDRYPKMAERAIKERENITVILDEARSLQRDTRGVFHLVCVNQTLKAKSCIVTVGTFLNGKMHTGAEQTRGGRREQISSLGMNDLFAQVKTRPKRFKTGTPPRLRKSSLNFSQFKEQPSENSCPNFHWRHGQETGDVYERLAPQSSCFLTYTNEKTMEIIREHKFQSPMFNGQIQAVGARYCPSIEDKAHRYPEKNTHHVFVEPEGYDRETMYPSGISSSLPKDVQDRYIRTIAGMEQAEIVVYGYAVEYDVIDTTNLNRQLESFSVPNLFFAGQVNGTSGYEEAAGQGLVAGLNAARNTLNLGPLSFSRFDSYIGVMIEDLVTMERDEPYRLFTARAENRLFLREDNAWERMWSYRTKLDLNSSHAIDRHLSALVEQKRLVMSFFEKDEYLLSCLHQPERFGAVLEAEGLSYPRWFTEHLRIDLMYRGYQMREDREWGRWQKLERKQLFWEGLVSNKNLSFECRQRIEKIRPETFGQLKRIHGIRPATVSSVAALLASR